MADPRVWLIGETNPYQEDPARSQRYALYFEPPESAGGRLCRLILGMDERDYLRSFARRNLLAGKWSAPLARASAACLTWELHPGDVVLLFGRKVFEAFFPELDWSAFMPLFGDGVRQGGALFIPLPHPSGLNRVWNTYGSYSQVRKVVREAAPHLASLLGRHPDTRGRIAAERETSHG